jgi:peptide/nickel transport system substrate-binding protein
LGGPRLISVVLLILTAVACTRGESPKGDVKGGDGVLRLSLPGEPKSLNPNTEPLDELAMFVGENIFSKLVARADDGTVLPGVAERWTEAADGRSYTFYIRPGIRFHDGTPLTAEDVRATFAHIGESANPDLAEHIAGVDVDAGKSVTIHLKAPWAAFLPTLAWFGASILPAHVYGGGPWKGNPANMKPIGSGPFRFKTWEPGRRIVLEKFPQYFGQGPYVDEVEYVIVDNNTTAARLLQEGRIDTMIGRPPSSAVAELSKTPGLRVSIAPSTSRAYLVFNVGHPPFSDLRLRRAVNLALDRRALVENALLGLGTPAFCFYTPGVAWAYNGQARVPDFNVAEAKRLVAEVAPSRPLMFPASKPPGGQFSPVVTEIMRQLEAVGLRVELLPVGPTDLLARLLDGMDFDLVQFAGDQGPDPDTMVSRFGSHGKMQTMHYSNPELDAVLARGGASTDPAERTRAYFRAQEILAADLPIAPLYESLRITIFRDGIRGLPSEDANGLVGDYAYNLVRLPKAPRAPGVVQ